MSKPIDEMNLQELFAEAERIGKPYQSPEEIAVFEAQYTPVAASVLEAAAKIEQGSPQSPQRADGDGRSPR